MCARTPLMSQYFKNPIKVPQSIKDQPSRNDYVKYQKYFGSVKSYVYMFRDKYGYFIKCPERVARAQFHDIFDVDGYSKEGDIVYVPNNFRHGY